jgi:hypothetical protein
MTDIFNPTDTPKDLAVTHAIEQAVECFVIQDFNKAARFFNMAEVFMKAPDELFALESPLINQPA